MMRRLLFVPALLLIAWFGTRAEDAAKEKLYVVSMEGGPDKIVIMSMNADGSGRTIIKTAEGMAIDPALSPDGKRLTYTLMDPKTKRSEILVANADGSEAKKVIAAEEKEILFSASWSPDGRRLAYSAMKLPERGPPDKIALMVIDADGKNAKMLGEGTMPAWSPDGKRILYTFLRFADDFDSHLRIMDADGTNNKELIKGKSSMGSYSPDGKRIAYIRMEKGNGGAEYQPRIYICNADGTEPKRITAGENDFETSPRWSGDGKRIFYNRLNNPEGGPMMGMPIFVMDADGKNVHRINKENGADFLGGGPLFFLMSGREVPAKKQ